MKKESPKENGKKGPFEKRSKMESDGSIVDGAVDTVLPKKLDQAFRREAERHAKTSEEPETRNLSRYYLQDADAGHLRVNEIPTTRGYWKLEVTKGEGVPPELSLCATGSGTIRKGKTDLKRKENGSENEASSWAH